MQRQGAHRPCLLPLQAPPAQTLQRSTAADSRRGRRGPLPSRGQSHPPTCWAREGLLEALAAQPGWRRAAAAPLQPGLPHHWLLRQSLQSLRHFLPSRLLLPLPAGRSRCQQPQPAHSQLMLPMPLVVAASQSGLDSPPPEHGHGGRQTCWAGAAPESLAAPLPALGGPMLLLLGGLLLQAAVPAADHGPTPAVGPQSPGSRQSRRRHPTRCLPPLVRQQAPPAPPQMPARLASAAAPTPSLLLLLPLLLVLLPPLAGQTRLLPMKAPHPLAPLQRG